MTISFDDPGWDWTSVLWTAVPVAAVVLTTLVFLGIYIKRGFRSSAGRIANVLGFIAVFGGTVTMMLAVVIGQEVHNDRVQDASRVALQDAGYEEVYFKGRGGFIASYNDEYFNGHLLKLVDDDGYTYQVVELVK